MAVETQEPIFSMTPPPSEFDEFDKSALLTCSPTLPGLCYPSPAPSNRGHNPSVSSESIFMLPGMSMSDSQSHDLHQISFEDTSSDSASFFPVPPVTDPTLASTHFHPTSASSSSSYTMYEQNQWFPYSNYSQPGPLLHYDPSSSTSYPPFDHPSAHHHPSLANIIPPTPQDIQRSFDFNHAPTSTIPSSHHLAASPAFSQISHRSSHSHRSSVSSLSRSCSPVSSLSRGHSGEPHTQRPSLRSNSTSSNTSLHAYGIPVTEPSSMLTPSLVPGTTSGGATQSWRCAYPGCTSRATFTRGCDLRKHYNRHSKHLFCRVDGCPQSEAAAAARAKSADQPLTGGFSSKKDRARHEAKHNPGIKCEWRGLEGEECGRVFSRMDNMKDHVRRIHNKGQQQQSQSQGSSRK